MAYQISIAIIDDQQLFREGLLLIFKGNDEMKVISHAGDGCTGISMVAKCKPDVVLLNYSLPDLTGFKVLDHLVKNTLTKTILLTYCDSASLGIRALRKGAKGYLLKSIPSKELFKEIRIVYEGGLAISENLVTERSKPKELKISLTSRQIGVLKSVAIGFSAKEGSTILSINTRTYETYKEALKVKFELHTVTDFIRFCLKEELLTGKDLGFEIQNEPTVAF
jgi:DNA-binding NarL/FixJ family response regulator